MIVGCHLGYSIGEWFLSYNELSFVSLVNFLDIDCNDCWLLYILLLIVFMVHDEFVLDSMEC